MEPCKTIENQPGTMKNHENQPGTMENHEKPTWSCTGRLWVGTGVSKEEVLIFRYTQTNRTFLLYIDELHLLAKYFQSAI